jgi:hypothetical protein
VTVKCGAHLRNGDDLDAPPRYRSPEGEREELAEVPIRASRYGATTST